MVLKGNLRKYIGEEYGVVLLSRLGLIWCGWYILSDCRVWEGLSDG